jgi:hypothetical protein
LAKWRSPKQGRSIVGASGKLSDLLQSGRQSAKPPTAKSKLAGGLPRGRSKLKPRPELAARAL